MRLLSVVVIAAFVALTVPAIAQPPMARKGPGFMKKGPGGRPFPEMVERFNNMSPAERSEALSKLPPARRRMMERRLEEWANTPPDQRRRLAGSYARFQEMTPERQREVRQIFREFSETFRDERRPEAMRAVRQLKRADADERPKLLESDRFRDSFNEEERKLIERMANELPDRP